MELAEIIKTSWSLSSLPVINNIKCVHVRHESKQKQDITVVIDEGLKRNTPEQAVDMVNVEVNEMMAKELRNATEIRMDVNAPGIVASMVNTVFEPGLTDLQDTNDSIILTSDDDENTMMDPETYGNDVATARPFDKNKRHREYIDDLSDLDELRNDRVGEVDGEVVNAVNRLYGSDESVEIVDAIHVTFGDY